MTEHTEFQPSYLATLLPKPLKTDSERLLIPHIDYNHKQDHSPEQFLHHAHLEPKLRRDLSKKQHDADPIHSGIELSSSFGEKPKAQVT